MTRMTGWDVKGVGAYLAEAPGLGSVGVGLFQVS